MAKKYALDGGTKTFNRILKSRGREEAVRIQAIMPGEAAPLLKKYMESFSRVQPYFEAKPGDPVERFAPDADKHPVFEILPG
jgi:hypothetical protein